MSLVLKKKKNNCIKQQILWISIASAQKRQEASKDIMYANIVSCYVDKLCSNLVPTKKEIVWTADDEATYTSNEELMKVSVSYKTKPSEVQSNDCIQLFASKTCVVDTMQEALKQHEHSVHSQLVNNNTSYGQTTKLVHFFFFFFF
ncbi:hypothetical protein RFI_31888 [Reticulomyxa filosa]|uniref:Uncharacterized protein n=1 Tax=Reticulomyxa filosa TaxID=46433 RepID=X6LXQ1_RETFI|nr:hypothetical protein RFI_31888 [Reticulomyxa filosa]|eukprot:ETO05510.1 hypothetical protein RFI_31888 [Reticulomyxa filosa]